MRRPVCRHSESLALHTQWTSQAWLQGDAPDAAVRLRRGARAPRRLGCSAVKKVDEVCQMPSKVTLDASAPVSWDQPDHRVGGKKQSGRSSSRSSAAARARGRQDIGGEGDARYAQLDALLKNGLPPPSAVNSRHVQALRADLLRNTL